MDVQKRLQDRLGLIVSKFAEQIIEIDLSIPSDSNRGDFTTNVAMQAFKVVGIPGMNSSFKAHNIPVKASNPMDLGEKIIEEFRKDNLYSRFSKIELVNPGFINFWLSKDEIESGLAQAMKGFDSNLASKSSLILEFGDLNPFKEPHIGHVRMLTLGESLARLLEFEGVEVVRANYEGDVGMHVAKCIWGILQISNLKSQISDLDNESLEERVKILASSYAKGAKAFEEDEEAKGEIVSINKQIYQKDLDILEIWQKGRKWSLDYFEQLYKKLGVSYDKYYFESEIAAHGKEIVESHQEVFPKDEGAYVFRGEDFGLHTRVFINSEGNPTYEAKDLGLAFAKDKDFPDIVKSVIMTANEQVDYFKVLLKALEQVNPKIAEKTSHLSMGFVNLKDGKMSSRTGNVVSANWLLEETTKKLKEGFKDVPDSVLGSLSVGAVKWSMLKFSRESNISFSIDESIDLAGNSGPYMQYTYARISSLLAKVSNANFEANSVKSLDSDLLALGRHVCQFQEVVKNSSECLAPNILTEYLFNLAQKFNAYYEKEKVIGTQNEEQKLAVIFAIGNVMKKGLDLLGIDAPEKI